jgi:hypothetical protein
MSSRNDRCNRLTVEAMAHLDVRERRIEATIAYLGPDFAGRTTNLLHLGGKPERTAGAEASEPPSDLVSIEWRPIGLSRFDDCDVAVRILAPRGPLDDENVRRIVQDADGVVVVLDADPSAMARNKAWLDPARELLDRRDGAAKTVVVQLNKSDVAPTDPLAELLDALDLGEWPRVAASAARGDGVVETVRCALERVLADLEGADAREPVVKARADTHPLLTALRQILTEAIGERVGTIEERVVERIVSTSDARVAALEERVVERIVSTSDARVAALEERIAAAVVSKVDEALRQTRSELAALEEKIVARTAAATLERVAALHADFAESSVQIMQLRDALAAHESRVLGAVETSASAEAIQKRDVEASEKRIRDDVAATARVDREHQAASITALRRAVEALKVDLRPLDHTSEIKTVAERLAKLTEKLDEAFAVVVPTAAAVRSIPLRMGESQDRTRNVVLKSVEELGQRVDASLEGLQNDSGPVWARIDARSAKVEVAVDELLEELKKRKKGWFG